MKSALITGNPGRDIPVIAVIGAGQLGSRHLQALRSLERPLRIHVVDPSEASLKVAQERYEGLTTPDRNAVSYSTELPTDVDHIDIVINASNSNVRRKVIDGLFARKIPVGHLILEKILFNHRKDYDAVSQLLSSSSTRAWVNCSMRAMPFYANLKSTFQGQPFHYRVTGSRFGLVTNAIHYLDHIAYLAGTPEYTLHTQLLDPKPISSKRAGFLELNGTLQASYANGAVGSFTCYDSQTLPVMIEITSSSTRLISREWEQKAWLATEADGWKWNEIPAPIPFQSQMTLSLVEQLLDTGKCPLVPYEESKRIHLTLLDGLWDFMKRHGGAEPDVYPFT